MEPIMIDINRYWKIVDKVNKAETKFLGLSDVVSIWEGAIKLKQEKLDKYTTLGYETKAIELRAEIRLLAQCVDTIKEHLSEEEGVALWDSELQTILTQKTSM